MVHPETGKQVPHGEVGNFCVTPLWTGHATPLLRWDCGDRVCYTLPYCRAYTTLMTESNRIVWRPLRQAETFLTHCRNNRVLLCVVVDDMA